jgi:hypothetical protein
MENIIVATLDISSSAYQAFSMLKSANQNDRLLLQSGANIEQQAKIQPIMRDFMRATYLFSESTGAIGSLMGSLSVRAEPAAIVKQFPLTTTALISGVNESAVEVIDRAEGQVGTVFKREAPDGFE